MAKIPAAIRQALALCLEVYAPAQRRKEGWTSNFWDCQEVEIAARSISKFAPGTTSQGEGTGCSVSAPYLSSAPFAPVRMA
ncbi:hypothetical protein TNCV_3359921 [Trichonephila clavipes]|nr:hypothetical protein TNCV_3359921 [Trichonephila clavipes]